MHRLSRVPVVAWTLMVAGCPGPEELEPAEDCEVTSPGDTSMLPTREVALGRMDGSAFKAYAEGEQVEVISGGQGASMITPYIELPVIDGDEDRSCWWVRVDYHDADGGEEFLGYGRGLVFERFGSTMRAGPLFEPVYLQGIRTATVTVVGDDFVAVHEVEIQIGS